MGLQGRFLDHDCDGAANRIRANGLPISFPAETGQRILMPEYRMATDQELFVREALLQTRDQIMQPFRQPPFECEHVELLAGRQSVKGRQVFVAHDFCAEQCQRAIQRIEMPIPRSTRTPSMS